MTLRFLGNLEFMLMFNMDNEDKHQDNFVHNLLGDKGYP
jgi:hypothetical protein